MSQFINGGQAVIEDGAIVIRIPVSTLPMIVEGAWASGGMETRYKITDVEEFTKDIISELNKESEDGSTRIHRMFDGVIEESIGQGAFGIEEHEEQEA